MAEEPILSPEMPETPETPSSSPRSPKPSSQFSKIWSWLMGNVKTAIGTLVVSALLYGAYHFWDSIKNVPKTALDAMIISAIDRELKDPNSSLMAAIKNTIHGDLLADQSVPTKIHEQAKTILDSALKHKIGPLYVGRFTLDSTNPQRIVEVFWRAGHSTKLWVNAIQLGGDDCIILQFPGGQQTILKREGASNPIDVEAHLAALTCPRIFGPKIT